MAGGHPVDGFSDSALREAVLSVELGDFPVDIAKLWDIEHERYRETCGRIPPASREDARLLDIGSTRPLLPLFQVVCGYRDITLNTCYPEAQFVEPNMTVAGAAAAKVDVAVFDAERDRFPFDDASFDVVTALEVLEHLAVDPMAMLAEINRVLKPGGTLVITTPNVIRTANVVKMLLGEHPQGWSPYNGLDTNRHNREYTPDEMTRLFHAAGITVDELATFGRKPTGHRRRALALLLDTGLTILQRQGPKMRRNTIIAAGRKTADVRARRPSWLYYRMSETFHQSRKRDDAQQAPTEESPAGAARHHAATAACAAVVGEFGR